MSSTGPWVPPTVAFERKQTEMWIKTSGLLISLIRPAPLEQTGSGGYASDGEDQVLPPVMRIVSTQARENFFQGGDIGIGLRIKQYILGTYDDDIHQGDKFVNPNDNKTYTVESVHPDRTVETRGELTELSD